MGPGNSREKLTLQTEQADPVMELEKLPVLPVILNCGSAFAGDVIAHLVPPHSWAKFL